MGKTLKTAHRAMLVGAALLVGAGFALAANAQTAPAAGSVAAARQSVDVRKAVFTLIGSNCRVLADVLKGNVAYDAADVQKRAARIAFLAPLLGEAFPEASNLGEPDSKAKPDIWANRADFDKKLQDLQAHSAALVQVAAVETSNTDAYKTAFSALAQDCKGCHETYKVK